MKHCLFFIFVLTFFSCKDKYNIPVRDTDRSVLVVEGFLNGGAGGTSIRISRSSSLNNNIKIQPVSQAQVTVEGDNGTNYSLTEVGNTGEYAINQLPLSITAKYRVRIKAGNKEYASEYTPYKPSPPIDSINWRMNNDNVMIYANTHDNSQKSLYYYWQFEETWEIRANYFSSYKVQSETIFPRTLPAESVFQCWKYAQSNNVFVSTTEHLQSDVVFEFPLKSISKFDERFGFRYSILVKQHTLTKEAYQFFQLMKRNTEQMGSIFDPLPSEIRGNIKCLSHPEDQVIGFISASSLEEKRIFIRKEEVPGASYNVPCSSFTINNNPSLLLQAIRSFYLPYADEKSPAGNITLYHFAPAACTDCTRRGGNTLKPSYW